MPRHARHQRGRVGVAKRAERRGSRQIRGAGATHLDHVGDVGSLFEERRPLERRAHGDIALEERSHRALAKGVARDTLERVHAVLRDLRQEREGDPIEEVDLELRATRTPTHVQAWYASHIHSCVCGPLPICASGSALPACAHQASRRCSAGRLAGPHYAQTVQVPHACAGQVLHHRRPHIGC